MNPAIPEELERIIMKCLQKDVFKRYQNAKELLSDIQRFMNQNYSTFTPMDAAAYLNNLFADEFSKQRTARSKINEEARDFMLKSGKIDKNLPLVSSKEDFKDESSPQTKENSNVIHFNAPTPEQSDAARVKIELGPASIPSSFSSMPSIRMPTPETKAKADAVQESDSHYLLYAGLVFFLLIIAAVIYYFFG